MNFIQTYESFLINESEGDLSQLIADFPIAKTKFFKNYKGEEIELKNIFTKTANETKLIFGIGNKSGKKTSVDLDDLIPTQDNISKDVLLQKINDKSNDLPVVAMYGEKYYIIHGHHRLALEKLKGFKTATVKLVKV